MKIALIIPAFVSGGAERTVSNLSLLMQEKHEVFVVLFDVNNRGYPHGGTLVDLRTPASQYGLLGKIITLLRRAYRLKKLFKKEKFDGVFALMEAAGAPAVLADRNTIVSVRDTPESFSSFYQKLLKHLYPRAQKVVAVAKATEYKLQHDYGLNNTTTIYNMADIKTATEKSKAPIDVEQPFILAVGRLSEQKGFDFLIEAYAKSKAKNHVNLLILGEGSERQALETLIKENNVEDKVTLYGTTDNPFAFYAKADFFVLSSRHEGFPNILVEALACHCACLSVDCPTGPNEIITDNENGLLIETENVPKLTESIDRLYFDNDLKARFRENAQASVAYLQPDSIVQEWINLIK